MDSARTEKKRLLLPYQRRWLLDASRMKIWLASRQSGKSFALSLEAVLMASKKKCVSLLLSSSERQSREMMEKVATHLRVMSALGSGALSPLGASQSEVRLRNGSRIISLPANPDTVRGFAGNIFLDEFAFHDNPEAIWRAMYPTATRGYSVRIASTPNGKGNLFHKLWSSGDGFSRHETDIYKAVSEGLKADIEDLKKNAGDPETWAQEFQCKFLDETTAFFTYELLSTVEDEAASLDMRGEPSAPQGPLFMGVDIGRVHDLTVFWVWERVGDVLWTRMVREMRAEPFRVQKELLFALLDGTFFGGKSSISACAIDSGGIGAQLSEEARERFGAKVEAATFTQKSKEELAIGARTMAEERKIRIPKDIRIREDFHSIRRGVTATGALRFDAERTADGHADRFWAAALGISASRAAAKVTSAEYEQVKGRTFAGRGPAW